MCKTSPLLVRPCSRLHSHRDVLGVKAAYQAYQAYQASGGLPCQLRYTTCNCHRIVPLRRARLGASPASRASLPFAAVD